jgi:ubiquinol-cytochrome c reductase cytochrome b subunit
MPSFGTEKSLTEREIALIVDWIRGEWVTPTTAKGTAPKGP